ncbi:hypothetical protein, partial [Novosphingobium resinovorum]|uniref:hypothetical protein n=1 Tax=Novosphingobium resinovorum TaxID=158500 RepID=UPI002ED05AC4|nr:hypothetical protein [Novosphingobium resinovorum]
AKSTPGMMEIGPNDALGAPRSLDVIKPARFARNYPVFAGLQLDTVESSLKVAGHVTSDVKIGNHEGAPFGHKTGIEAVTAARTISRRFPGLSLRTIGTKP